MRTEILCHIALALACAVHSALGTVLEGIVSVACEDLSQIESEGDSTDTPILSKKCCDGKLIIKRGQNQQEIHTISSLRASSAAAMECTLLEHQRS